MDLVLGRKAGCRLIPQGIKPYLHYIDPHEYRLLVKYFYQRRVQHQNAYKTNQL